MYTILKLKVADTSKYKWKTIKLLEENTDTHVYATPGLIHFLFDLKISGTIDSRFVLVFVCQVLYILGSWELIKTLRKVSQGGVLLEKRNRNGKWKRE